MLLMQWELWVQWNAIKISDGLRELKNPILAFFDQVRAHSAGGRGEVSRVSLLALGKPDYKRLFECLRF